MRGIAFRFWVLVSLLLTVFLLIGGGIEAWFAYLDSIEGAERLQRLEARAAGDRIDQYLKSIESQIQDAATLPWASGALSTRDMQEEFHRLLKLVPAITAITNFDERGREQLYVSRTSKDRVNSLRDVAPELDLKGMQKGLVVYGPVSFREGARPFVLVVVRESTRPESGFSAVDLDLKFVTDVVQRITIGHNGKAYVVDRNNRLLAHPNLSLVLRNTDLSRLPHVVEARKAITANAAALLPARWSLNPEGDKVLASAVHIPGPDWLVFAEEPEVEALEPVREILYQTMTLMVVGLLVAFVASRALAGVFTRPIMLLREGAARIGGGDLDARIAVHTHDEIESLGEEFNQMAAKLKESYAGLEAKVEARTRELAATRDQVQHQAQELAVLNAELTARVDELGVRKEEAERANAAKTRFLASASHDLRQPMHTIGLLVGILRDRMRNDESRELAAKVEASVGVMQNLFSSLLDISKLDSGTITPSIVDFRIDDMLRRVEANFGPQAEERGLSIKVVPSRAMVRSDPILLERILANLVANAIRYTREGRVLVGCRRRGAQLRILVIDTGIGIAAENLEIVFEEFVQLANPERDRTKGLGLGLSIVRRSADLLGHALIIQSKPGQGSQFGIDVPMASRAQALLGSATEALEAWESRLGGAFVIVIDDDQESRLAMEAVCVHWGCHVATAGSPNETRQTLENHLRAPDLIITDYRLRDGATGMDAIAQVRSQCEQSIPAIVVTGDISAPELENVRVAGIVLLHKPVDVDTLRRAAEDLLDGHVAAFSDRGKRST